MPSENQSSLKLPAKPDVSTVKSRRQVLLRASLNGEYTSGVFYPGTDNKRPTLTLDGLRGFYWWDEIESFGGYEFVAWLSEETECRSNLWQDIFLEKQEQLRIAASYANYD
jgi:hypothetical protein